MRTNTNMIAELSDLGTLDAMNFVEVVRNAVIDDVLIRSTAEITIISTETGRTLVLDMGESQVLAYQETKESTPIVLDVSTIAALNPELFEVLHYIVVALDNLDYTENDNPELEFLVDHKDFFTGKVLDIFVPACAVLMAAGLVDEHNFEVE